MIIEFTVSNFRSFQDRQVFSMLPSGKIRERVILPVKTENYNKLSILPTAVLYGANNAGKSNFLKAVRALRWLVQNSGNFNSDAVLEANEFFALNKQTQNQASCFEIDFIARNNKRYFFKVVFDRTYIIEESLYTYNVTKTGKVTVVTLYERTKQTVKFSGLRGVKESINFGVNQLLLSRGDIAGNEELKEVYSFFSKKLQIVQMTEVEYTDFLTREYAKFTTENKDSKIPKLIEQILNETDSGILGIKTDLLDDQSKISFPSTIPQELKDKIFEDLKYQIMTRHKLFDHTNESGEQLMSLNEQSTGTRKLLGLMPLILLSLANGTVLFIDEMNTSMHTEITTWLIDLFNNPETNPNRAQLIITTHDIVLLDKQLFEKDQVFIASKNEYSATDLYSFADFKWSELQKSRSNPRLLDFYETGRLGGVPHIVKPYLESLIHQFLTDGKAE